MTKHLKIALLTGLLTISQIASATVAYGYGQIRRIDTKNQTITIKQSAIKAFKLPAITLVYHIMPTIVNSLKAGQKVSFKAEQKDNQYFILEIKESK